MMNNIISAIQNNTVIRLVIIAVVMDTIFGVMRALKQHKLNSSVGIDGAIRKIAMLISLVCLAIVDTMLHINMLGFLPDDALQYLPDGISSIGCVEFFGMLYMCYEVVSILKNMALCGLPVKKIWITVRNFLGKYTEELPDTEEQDKQQELIMK